MILAALALALMPAHAADDFVVAAKLCMSAVGATGVDEAVLTDAGWVRVTTDAEEAAGSVRTYAKRGAVPIQVPLRNGRPGGCVPQSDAAPEGGIAALVAAFDRAFGQPRLIVPGMRQWRLPSHSILFVDTARTDKRVSVAVTYLAGASE